jgi:hypothetical protein
MLSGMKDPPAIVEGPRSFSPEQALDGRIAIRYIEACKLVVPIVLKARKSAERRIDGRRWVPPLGQDERSWMRRVLSRPSQ